jgi:hypothetical protein
MIDVEEGKENNGDIFRRHVTHRANTFHVGLIWRQIMESVCVHLHQCDRVVHLTGSAIYGGSVRLS